MSHPHYPRRGSIPLVIVLILITGVVALVVAGSDRMHGMKKLAQIELAKQRSGAAAEAVAAMVESRLMDAAADYTKLLVSVDTDPGTGEKPWWGLRGCIYKDAAGKMHGPGFDAASEGLWLNGCLVRWMVEPVRVYDTVWNNAPANDAEFVVNPPSDPSTVNQWEAAAKIGPDGAAVPGSHNKNTNDFYHFRIVAQAYALTDAQDTSAQPWTIAGHHLAASQSMRVLQVQSLQLFKYALFYAADAPVGDLDLQTGGRIWVKKGAVHSNGAIYIRGGESNGFNNKNWHYMASGDSRQDALTGAGQNIYLGEKEYPITITGVAGVFRMGKTANHLAALHALKYADSSGSPVLFDPARPMDVPTDRRRFLSDSNPSGRAGGNPLDLNGDVKDSDRHRLNGANFHCENDSRTPQGLVKDFNNYVRDANNGGLRVATLQNLPELGGRPFEPQSVVFDSYTAPSPLYGDPANPLGSISRYRRKNGINLVPLFYTVDPTAGSGPMARPATRAFGKATTNVSTNGASGLRPILAEEMRLWWDGGFKIRDVVNPSQEVVLRDQIPAHAGLSGYDADDGAKYRLGATLLNSRDVDREQPCYYDKAGALQQTAVGTLSFPGVGLLLPDGITWWEPRFFGCGYSPREVKGTYLEAALFGDLPVSGTQNKQQQYYKTTSSSNLPLDINTTGIVIRERRWQQRPRIGPVIAGGPDVIEDEKAWNLYWPGEGLKGATSYLGTASAIPRPVMSAVPTAQQKLDYVQYLCSQYVVLFCGRNITAPFFGQILTQNNMRDFIVTEDEFVDPRESGYMWGLYGAKDNTFGTHGGTPTNDFYQYDFYSGDQPATYPDGGMVTARDFRQNVLTIHMRAFQFWLRNTPMDQLGYQGSTVRAREHFSGVLYCHRTRRSDSMHPLLTPELDWPGMTRVANNVETSPQRLVDQTHFRAYWLKEVATPSSLTLPADYPPINFPWNWREPSGPLETTRCATRLRGQLNDGMTGEENLDPTYYRVFWDHSTPESTTDPLGTSAFTYITPQRLYLWGNFAYRVANITNDTAGTSEVEAALEHAITPCAVFADNFTMQSVNWADQKAQYLPQNPPHHWQSLAGSTCFFTAMVINNSPNAAWNCGSFGSAGQEGTFRMMEDWGGQHLWWSGSQVVMNIGRYHHSGHNYVSYNRAIGRTRAPAHMGVGAFHTGNNHYLFNTNLFKREGRPPLSPSGVAATRVVNQVTHFGE